jgi:hypothetical protein
MHEDGDIRRARLQMRAVLVVFRAERRAAAEGRRASDYDLADLRARSAAVLDEVEDQLRADGVADRELLLALANARAEVESDD